MLTSNDVEGGLTNFQLMDIAEKIGLKLSGVLMKDQLKKNTFKPGAYIVNLQNSGESGSHWISCYYSDKGDIIYFDSYGQAPVQELIKLMPYDIFYNNKQIQDYHSSYCGIYCLAFLSFVYGTTYEDGMIEKFNKFIKCFKLGKKQLKKNDEIVLNIINNLTLS
jgi:hypothetical protein